MKVAYILLVVLLLSCKWGKDVSTFEQSQISPELTVLVNMLIETDYIGTEKMGRSSSPSAAYANREALLSIATEEELIKLISHPEGEVAATAFEGLSRRNYNYLKRELLNLSEGDRQLSYIKGDIVFVMPALEYAYVNILGNEFRGNSGVGEQIRIGLEPTEKAFIENRIMAIRQNMQ